MNNRNILIIGAGFAGITLALRLKKYQRSFEIYEAMEKPSSIGGGVTIFPNGMRVLREIGVADQVIQEGVTMEKAKFQDKSGKHLVSRSMGITVKYGEPTITIMRSALNKILLRRATEENIVINYNKSLYKIEKIANQVVATFSDGTTIESAAIVGCDGISSKVRDFVLQEEFKPEYSELVYVAGFVKDESLIKKLSLDHNTQYISIGSTNFFGYNYIRNPKNNYPLLFWNTYLNKKNRLSKYELNKISDEQIISWVKDVHLGWHSSVKELIDNTVEICRANLSDVVEIDKWSSGRVLVLGDAAHSMNPISGQGACTAMEDAYILAELMKERDADLEYAFRKLENIRRARVTKIARKARKSSKLLTTRFNPFVEKIRNLSFALLTLLTPDSIANKTFKYDVKEVVKNYK